MTKAVKAVNARGAAASHQAKPEAARIISTKGVNSGNHEAATTRGASGFCKAGTKSIIGAISSKNMGVIKDCDSCKDSHKEPTARKITPYML